MNQGITRGKTPHSIASVICAILAAAGATTSFSQTNVPVPKQTFTTPQLHTKLRTFTAAEVGQRPTFAAMHRGHLVISGGFADANGQNGKLSTWRLSQSATPNNVGPSRVGVHENNAIFKSHAMGFSGELTQIRASKFTVYDLTNMAAPTVAGVANGGISSSHSSAWGGKYIYTGGEGYGEATGFVDVWDVSNPAAPVRLRSVDVPALTGFRCASVYVIGNVMVVSASLTNGVATFDLNNPADPQLLDVNRDDIGANTYTSYLSGNRLYGGGQNGGFFVYDISDPRNIQVVGHMNPGGTIRYPVLQDEFIHVGNLGNGRYQKIRIDTMPPVLVADIPGFPQAEVAIPIGNLAFVGTASADPNAAGWLIPHDTAVDNRPPVINAIRPINGETNVGLHSMIGVSFTDLLDGPSVNNTSIIVRPQGGTALTGTYAHMGGIVNFSPSGPLQPNTIYEIVVVAGGIKDCSGNAVVGQTISTFSTGSLDATGLGLTLRYPLDETSGTNASDSAGTNPGTLFGFTTPPSPWTTDAAVGTAALTFDGINDFIRTPSFNTGDTFTVSTYVRVPSGTTGLHNIVGNATGGYSVPGWKLFVYGSANTTPGRVAIETGNISGVGGNAASTANNVFPFDRWVHLAATINRTTGTARIWIDGEDLTVDSTIRNDFPTTGELNWGRMVNSGAYLLGQMDDLRLYNRILPEADLLLLRNLAPLTLAHWRLNGDPNDSSPAQRHLTLSATGATYNISTDTAEGTASLALNGTLGHAISPSLELGSAFTASAWVKLNSGNATLNTIFGNTGSGYHTDGWKCFVYGSTHATTPGRIQVETGNGTLGNASVTAINTLPFDQWVHIAIGVDRPSGICRIYLNGVDVTLDQTIVPDFRTLGPVHLGQMANNSYRLAGSIDDVRLHGRWIDDNEIALLAVGKLQGHWSLEGSDADLSGFNRPLTRRNGANFVGEAAKGSLSLGYDGINDYADAPAFSLGDKITLSLWAKMPSGLPPGSRTLLSNSPGGSLSNGFRWFVNNWATNNLALVFETANGTLSANIYAPAGTFLVDQWNHLAMVIDRTTGTADIYCNRRKVNTTSPIRADFGNLTSLNIGAFTGGSAPWLGQIDEVRVYSETASHADIAALGHGSPNIAPIVNTLASNNPAQTTSTSVTFTANVTDPNVGEQFLYLFNYGDGTQSNWQTSPTSTRTYTAPGRHIVTVTVSDGYTTSLPKQMTQIIYNPITANPPSIASEMVFDASRNKVWCVVPDGDNHDNNIATPPIGTIVRFDATTLAVEHRVNLGNDTEPVSCTLRPGSAEIWVVCKNSKTNNGEIKILNASTAAVLSTINIGRGYLPTGVAFAPNGTAAFVACEGAEGVLKYNPTTRALLGSQDIGGPARSISVASDSTRVFVTRFRSPNSGGQVLELNASTLAITRTFTLAPDTTTIDGPNSGRGLPNYLMQTVISPDGRRGWIPAKKDNIYRGLFRDGNSLNHENSVRSLVAQLDLINNNEPIGNRIDLDDAHFPAALAFSPRGDLVFAAMIGNEQINVIDANTRNTLSPINATNGSDLFGHAPTGLCVSPDGSRLYVHNFLERRVRVFDITQLTAGTGSATPLAGTVNLVIAEPLASNVLQGKKLFHNARDPRLALDGYISCASCHIGGDHDGRTWDLGNFGEGLRQTIDLRGHGGMSQGALHWSANFNEIQDFEGQIRDLSGGTGLIANGTPHPPLGTANAGRSTDLDALAAYLTSLSAPLRSPFRNADGTLTAAAINGQTHFTTKGCATCHSGTQFTDSNATTFLRHNIGTQTTQSGNRLNSTLGGIDTPTLKALWSKSPYLHRGQATNIEDIFTPTHAPGTTNHARFRELTAPQQAELIEYLLQIE
ncbi:PKD domain-containing protein [Phragmitibacter flavus]|uniref:PKD domain-containing protein n=1 Tax=Phragmitibacter flavus TaxID=2576071 RepID=A0A5R8KE98_9BACT|nr:LamG-like jellyroll fold domain-containing protein [Phragmitibacter flavus]TLD70275.1 PKD domain-containing protein [Phragmitibacter flavus]